MRLDCQRLDPDPLLLRRHPPRDEAPGGFMYRVLEGEDHFLAPAGLAGAARLPAGRRRRRRAVLAAPTAVGLLAFSAFTLLVTYAIQRLQHVLPFNPQGLAAVEAELRLQHGGELHDQHELAGLRGRGHDELPEPDGRPRLAQLHLGGRGHRGRDRAGARPHPRGRRQAVRAPSATSGWTSRAPPCTSCCRSRRLRPRLRLAGRDPELLAPYHEVDDARGRQAGDRAWARSPRRRPSSSSAPTAAASSTRNAAHPFENPNPLTNFLSMFLIFLIPAGAHLHVRPHGRRPAAGLGALRRHEPSCSSRGSGVAYWAEARRATRSWRRGRRSRPSATWRARRSASASRTPRSTRP